MANDILSPLQLHVCPDMSKVGGEVQGILLPNAISASLIVLPLVDYLHLLVQLFLEYLLIDFGEILKGVLVDATHHRILDMLLVT